MASWNWSTTCTSHPQSNQCRGMFRITQTSAYPLGGFQSANGSWATNRWKTSFPADPSFWTRVTALRVIRLSGVQTSSASGTPAESFSRVPIAIQEVAYCAM
ncbi:unnamed protein product, partial [Nesidiocoris tenuis]